MEARETTGTCFVIGPMGNAAQMGRQHRLAEIVREAFAQLKRNFDVQTLRVVQQSVQWRVLGGGIQQESPAATEAIVKREFDRFFVALRRWTKEYLAQERMSNTPNEQLIDFTMNRLSIGRLSPDGIESQVEPFGIER